MMNTTVRSYSELIQLPTFDERFQYLKLDGAVGVDTFGFDRYLNQAFYNSREWKRVRDYVITRDNGCDLAIEGYELRGKILIHHMNPITPEDLAKKSDIVLDPEFLISTCHNTHNAIHYGDDSTLNNKPVERKPNDTCPWRKN